MQVPVRCGNDPDINPDRVLAPDPVDFLFLQHPQQLGLQDGRHLADFIQQQGAPMGQFELARLGGRGSGKRSLLESEQLALQQILGKGRAIDRHKGAGSRPRAPRWIMRASSSFPVPLSASIRTVAVLAAPWTALSSTLRKDRILGEDVVAVAPSSARQEPDASARRTTARETPRRRV